MTYYLGALGALVGLPDPEAGLPMTPERIGGSHQLLSGAKVRDTIGYLRSWNLSWTAITLAQYGLLEGFYLGFTGAGPFYFLDDEQTNLLALNVSTATNTTLDTTGFTAESSGSVSSSTNSLSNFAAIGGPWPPPATQTLLITVPTTITANAGVVRSATDIPVAVGAAYTFSSYASVANGATFGIAAVISWLNAAGASIGTVTGNTVAANSTGRTSASGTAPAGAVRARVRLVSTATNTTGSAFVVYAQGLQFEMNAAVTTWQPGVPVPLVTVEALSRTTPLAGICDAQMTLEQVG